MKKKDETSKSREQFKITVVKIDLSELIRVHRFTRNHPWLKVNYGNNYKWIAESAASGDGFSAEWVDLLWSFNIERNETDRQDLVIAVCSKDLIIGRYIIRKTEWAHVPDTDTGFFVIEGEVINGIGFAGRIQVLCQKSVADRPAPVNLAALAVDDTTESLTANELLQQKQKISSPTKVKKSSSPNSPNLQCSSVFTSAPRPSAPVAVRVLSIAVMDLKSVHIFESNSPSVSIESGSWMGMTEALRGSGMTGRWSNIAWRFKVHKDIGMVASVYSNSTLIGKVLITTDELVNIEPIQGVYPIIKHISNGKEFTGKIKLNMIINHPEDANDGETGVAPESSVGDFEMLPDAVQNVFEAGNELGATSISIDGDDDDEANENGDIGDADLSTTKQRVSGLGLPFTITVQEMTILDVVVPTFQKLMGQPVMKVHCACGSWAGSTKEINSTGRFVHWLDMKWKVPIVAENNHFRTTLWSNGNSIGASSLSVRELLGMPSDKTGRVEIFTKLINDKRLIVGKVRLICRYESGKPQHSPDKLLYTSPTHRISAISTGAPPRSFERSHNNQMQPLLFSRNNNSADTDVDDTDSDSVAQDKHRLRFPLVAVVRSIALVDLVSMQTLSKNSPTVMFSCDRKSAVTGVQLGAGQVARWDDLNWVVKVREDSNLNIVVTSKSKIIGKATIDPQSFQNLPKNSDGITEIGLNLKNGQVSGGKAMIKVILEESLAHDAEEASKNQSALPANPYLAPLSSEPRLRTPNSTGDGFNQSFIPDASGPGPYTGQPWFHGSHDSQFATVDNHAVSPTPIIFDPALLTSEDAARQGILFKFKIGDIDIWDVKSVHTWAANSPYIAAACGKWTATTPAQPLAGSSCFWCSLDWTLTLQDRSAKLRLNVNSRDVVIGTAIFSVEDMLRSKADDTGVKRVSADFIALNQCVGHVKIAFLLEIIQSKQAGSVSLDSSQSRSRGSAGPSIPIFGAISPAGNLQPTRQEYAIRSSTMDSIIADEYDRRNSVNFPCMMNIKDLAAMELLIPKRFGKRLPYIKVFCENFFHSTAVDTSGSDFSAFMDLNWSFPVSQASKIVFTVMSKSTEVGVCECPMAEFAVVPVNAKGFREMTIPVLQQGLICGKLIIRGKFGSLNERDDFFENQSDNGDAMFARKVAPYAAEIADPAFNVSDGHGHKESRYMPASMLDRSYVSDIGQESFAHHNDQDNRFHLPYEQSQQQQQQQQRLHPSSGYPPLSTYNDRQPLGNRIKVEMSTLTLPSIAPMNHASGANSVGDNGSVANRSSNSYLLTDSLEGPLSVQIVGIAAIDLPAVHTFVPNSPACSIACGRFAASTSICENGGRAAVWEALDIYFSFEKSSIMRCLLTSKDKTIGYCNFSRSKLLNGRKTQSSSYVVVGELLTLTSKSAGKLKIVYNIDDTTL